MHVQPALAAARHHAPAIITLLFTLAIVAALGSTYFGSSSSPYGTCTTPSGRQVDCAALRAASR
jgi:hypothetical protein